MSTLEKPAAKAAAERTQIDGGKLPRPDPYQQVTDLIIEHLEKGVVPWRCPWNREVGRPRNFSTGKAYRGVNVVLLGCRQFDTAASPWWMTYRQATERGGHVRKGEHGALVVKYGTFELKESAAVSSEDGKKRQGRFLRTFTVFNGRQIEGIEFPETAKPEPLLDSERLSKAQDIFHNMPQRPPLREGAGNRAVYRPLSDEIEMPAAGTFESQEAFFLTLFHELVHATGHASRLNRQTLTGHDGFGGKVYSQEELVAEVGAAFLGMVADIVDDRHEQSASYLDGWLNVLKAKDHRRWIVQAASQASRAADFILGKSGDDNEPQFSTED